MFEIGAPKLINGKLYIYIYSIDIKSVKIMLR